MTAAVRVRAALITAVLATLAACSTAPAPTPTTSPTPTASPPPTATLAPSLTPTAPPTPEPSASASPTTTPEPSTGFWDLLLGFLGVPSTAPVEADESGDGVSPDGTEPRDISADLDLQRGFAGVGNVPAGVFETDECELPAVVLVCPPDPPAIEGQAVLVGIQTHDDIAIGADRAGQIAVAFDREGIDNAPAGAGGFGDADWVVIVDLEGSTVTQLEWSASAGTYQPSATGARALLAGDLALIVVPFDGEVGPTELRYRVVAFERIPVDDVEAGRLDSLPAFGGDPAESFFDVFVEAP
jgi:hypothetical protein